MTVCAARTYDPEVGRRAVRVLGFPLTVNPGFVAFMVLMFVINIGDPRFALALVISFAGFTVVHELGHGLAARCFEADTTISLDFLVGLADVQPRRPLARWEQAVITAAGPLTAVGLGVAILAAQRAPILSLTNGGDGRVAAAIRWTGPVLGLLNLLPLAPLDGGNLVSLGVDRVVPGRGRAVVQIWSIAACLAAALVIVAHPRWWLWAISVALVAAWNVQGMRAQRRATRLRNKLDQANVADEAHAAERAGWTTGEARRFPQGWSSSPWLQARRRLHAGDLGGARSILMRSLTAPSGAWTLPSGAPTDELAALVDLLPPDPPVERLHGAWALQSILHQLGLLRRSADYGALVHDRHQSSEVAHQIARSLALLGDDDGAVAWLVEAHAHTADTSLLDDDTELDSLHDRADFQSLRVEIAQRADRDNANQS